MFSSLNSILKGLTTLTAKLDKFAERARQESTKKAIQSARLMGQAQELSHEASRAETVSGNIRKLIDAPKS